MDSSFRFSEREQPTALVIVFPLGVSGLFNADVHGLVRDVEKHLEGVYVTYALSSGASPNVRDAINAARFLGCDSAVVVQTVESDGARTVDVASGGDWLLPSSSVHGEFDASAIVDAYVSALSDAGIAA